MPFLIFVGGVEMQGTRVNVIRVFILSSAVAIFNGSLHENLPFSGFQKHSAAAFKDGRCLGLSACAIRPSCRCPQTGGAFLRKYEQ